MTKKKAKIMLLSLLWSLGLVAGFYFSGFMHITLTSGYDCLEQLRFGILIKSLLTDQKHLLLFIGIEVIIASLVVIFVLLNKRETYESDVKSITANIATQIKVGQGQHGTAKWLSAENYSSAFAVTDLEVSDYPYRELLEQGENLRKEIKDKQPLSDKPLDLQAPVLDYGGLVVGYKKKHHSEKIYYLDEDIHSCIIGATRSGKTRCLVLPSIALTALAGESMIISDPKGELFSFTAPYLRHLGYEVIALDFKTPLKSNKYNFLQPVIEAVKKNHTSQAVDLTWDITASLVGEASGEKIWTNGEAAIIAGAIMAVVFDNKERPEYQNFTNVYHFILNMCKTEGGEMPINKYIREIPDNHPAKGLFGIAQVAPARTRGSFFTAALTTLRLFTNENIYSQTCRSEFHLSETGSRKRAIFIILPDEKNTFYSLAALFTYQNYVALVEAADARGGRLINRVHFFLEEFGNFTRIPSFANLLTVGGGRGIRFHIFLQSFAQLDEKYGKEASETIKDNCHAWVYLKTANVNTAEIISKKLGQYTTSSYSRSSSYHSGGSYNANLSASMNLIARPLLTEDEIMRIERPYALVMLAGFYPAITKLPDLSQWHFNTMLGLGDKEHNRLLREYREQVRPCFASQPIQLWGLWNRFASLPLQRQVTPDFSMTPYERAKMMRRLRETMEEDDNE